MNTAQIEAIVASAGMVLRETAGQENKSSLKAANVASTVILGYETIKPKLELYLTAQEGKENARTMTAMVIENGGNSIELAKWQKGYNSFKRKASAFNKFLAVAGKVEMAHSA